LLFGERLYLVGVQDALLTTLDPVLVTGFDVEDMLVEEVSGLASGLRSVSCYIDWSA